MAGRDLLISASHGNTAASYTLLLCIHGLFFPILANVVGKLSQIMDMLDEYWVDVGQILGNH